MRIQTDVHDRPEWESFKSVQSYVDDTSYTERPVSGQPFPRPPAWIDGGLVVEVTATGGDGVNTQVQIQAAKEGEALAVVATESQVVDYGGVVKTTQFIITGWDVTGDYEVLQVTVTGPAPADVLGIIVTYRGNNPQ